MVVEKYAKENLRRKIYIFNLIFFLWFEDKIVTEPKRKVVICSINPRSKDE